MEEAQRQTGAAANTLKLLRQPVWRRAFWVKQHSLSEPVRREADVSSQSRTHESYILLTRSLEQHVSAWRRDFAARDRVGLDAKLGKLRQVTVIPAVLLPRIHSWNQLFHLHKINWKKRPNCLFSRGAKTTRQSISQPIRAFQDML